jgi:hypothetical protein
MSRKLSYPCRVLCGQEQVITGKGCIQPKKKAVFAGKAVLY